MRRSSWLERLLASVAGLGILAVQQAARALPEAGKMPLHTGLERPFWMSPWVVLFLLACVWLSYVVVWRNLVLISREGMSKGGTVGQPGRVARGAGQRPGAPGR